MSEQKAPAHSILVLCVGAPIVDEMGHELLSSRAYALATLPFELVESSADAFQAALVAPGRLRNVMQTMELGKIETPWGLANARQMEMSLNGKLVGTARPGWEAETEKMLADWLMSIEENEIAALRAAGLVGPRWKLKDTEKWVPGRPPRLLSEDAAMMQAGWDKEDLEASLANQVNPNASSTESELAKKKPLAL
jgi:hypothetical protein